MPDIGCFLYLRCRQQSDVGMESITADLAPLRPQSGKTLPHSGDGIRRQSDIPIVTRGGVSACSPIAGSCSQRKIRAQRCRTVQMQGRRMVEVLIGPDKGKHGIVNCIIRERNWVYVEGLNCKYRWVNRSSTNPGSLLKVEKPLLVTTEVSLVDPSDSKRTQVAWRYTEEGERVRVALRTGRIIPLTKIVEDETEDMVSKSGYVEQDWDTKADELKRVTFKPTLSTFEADILQQMNVKDDRKRAPTYWY